MRKVRLRVATGSQTNVPHGVKAMKVTVEFLSLPLITQPLGKKIDIEIDGSTLADLARELGSRIERAKDVLPAATAPLMMTSKSMSTVTGYRGKRATVGSSAKGIASPL